MRVVTRDGRERKWGRERNDSGASNRAFCLFASAAPAEASVKRSLLGLAPQKQDAGRVVRRKRSAAGNDGAGTGAGRLARLCRRRRERQANRVGYGGRSRGATLKITRKGLQNITTLCARDKSKPASIS